MEEEVEVALDLVVEVEAEVEVEEEGIDAIYLNDLENDFEDESDANTDEYGIDGSDYGDDY